jgi:Right handed beta helix region
MTPVRILFLLLLLIAVTAAAQPSDVAIGLAAPQRVPAGSDVALTLTVANVGSNATIAFVRIPHLVQRLPATTGDSRCHFSQPAMTCDVPSAAGQTIVLNVNIAAPHLLGRVTAVAEGFLYPVDFDDSNNRASASFDVIEAAELAVSIDVRPSLRPRGESTIYLLVKKLAALPVSTDSFITIPAPLQVRRTSTNCAPAGDATYRCAGFGGTFDVFVPGRGEPVTLTGWIEIDDFDPSNNRVVRVEPIYDLAKLKIEAAAGDRLDENATGTIRYSVTNESDFDAPNVVLTLRGGLEGRVVSASAPGCTANATGTLTCAIGTLAAGERREIVATFTYTAREGIEQTFFAAVQPLAPGITGAGVTLNANAVHYRYFVVTKAADDGAGSLREAILALNAQCEGSDAPPCKISIELDAPATLTPQSPLPVIRGQLIAVDGGGRLSLDGSEVAFGDGLSIEAGTLTVRGLTIRNFPGSGILAGPLQTSLNFFEFPSAIEHNTLEHNGMRGLMASVIGVRIRNNVIRHNARSGLFLEAWYGDVRDNRVESNGATGIFLGAFTTDSVVENNVIAGNREFGVAFGRLARAEIRGNAIAGNGAGGIDVGLDGPTADGAPHIESARFENGETVIEGRVASPGPGPSYLVKKTVYLFANAEIDADGFAEGEEFLGIAAVSADGTFALRVSRDLRGRWIDGSTLVVTDFGDAVYRTSSEFGPPLLVE